MNCPHGRNPNACKLCEAIARMAHHDGLSGGVLIPIGADYAKACARCALEFPLRMGVVTKDPHVQELWFECRCTVWHFILDSKGFWQPGRPA